MFQPATNHSRLSIHGRKFHASWLNPNVSRMISSVIRGICARSSSSVRAALAAAETYLSEVVVYTPLRIYGTG
jgi:hypothetical protein